MDSGSVHIKFHNLRALSAKSIYALVDAELDIAGVVIGIFDIQARHRPGGGGTSVHLPTHKDERGAPRTSLCLPEDLSRAVADELLTYLVELGVARERAGPDYS